MWEKNGTLYGRDHLLLFAFICTCFKREDSDLDGVGGEGGSRVGTELRHLC